MSRSKQRVLDSHVHLWPAETANEAGHSWMPPGMLIAKEQLPTDYLRATYSGNLEVDVQGLVFIETDVKYDTSSDDLSTWAKAPLEEISFVRRIVEGEYGDEASRLIVGIVPWAPMDQSPSVLDQYLDVAAKWAAEATWTRVKGFRYLVQSIVDQDRFKALVLGRDFLSNLKALGKRGFSFDIGVDQRSGGSWQLELMAESMELAHSDVEEDDKITFIINHLCKPDFSDTGAGFERWCNAISSMSTLSKTYMKLSGAFSELPSRTTLTKPSDIAAYLRPWITHVLKCFGTNRVMFGSDWPVCNLRGPQGEDSWVAWKDVVESILTDCVYDLGKDEQEHVWYKTGEEAYRLG